MEGKIEWNLSEVITRTVSRGQSESIEESKMVVGVLINIGGGGVSYVY